MTLFPSREADGGIFGHAQQSGAQCCGQTDAALDRNALLGHSARRTSRGRRPQGRFLGRRTAEGAGLRRGWLLDHR